MKKLLSLIVALLFPLTAKAGNVDTFGIGAKATALGGAFSAYADDPFAVYYNPAGLTQIASPTLSVGGEFLNPTLKVHNYPETDGKLDLQFVENAQKAAREQVNSFFNQ